MCTEKHYTYPTCGCTCVYQVLCPSVHRGTCHRIVSPPDPRAKRGLCPVCTIVEKDQRKRLATPGADVDMTAMRQEREHFAGGTWIELWSDRPSEEMRRSGEATQAHDEFRAEDAKGENGASQESKKSWTDGVRWNAKQSLEELKENIRLWKGSKKVEADRLKAVDEKQKADEIAVLVGSGRGSKESCRKSWRSGKSGKEEKLAGHAEGGNGSVVKVEVRSRWARWRRWLLELKRGFMQG